MNGRFAPAIVAFAAAAGVVAHAPILPEFMVQIHDTNVLGGALCAYLLRTFGYAFVVALCGVLTAATALLVAWRTRVRGASDWHAALAAILVMLCLMGRWGVSLDPIGWICAASFCLLLDRDDMASRVNALAVLCLWNLLQGGATLGALLAVVSLANGVTRPRMIFAAMAVVLGTAQLHAAPWHAYGAHALYLDALLTGAQRDRVWTGVLSPTSAAFLALLVVGAWYGVRRRSYPADAIAFFALLLLSLADARNVPYLGIAGAPVVADALASFYVSSRTAPLTPVRRHLLTFTAFAVAFVATITATEPKVAIWPDAPGEPATLLKVLAQDRHQHRLLCTQPRWCDGAHLIFPQIHPMLDDRAGAAQMQVLRVQSDVVHTAGVWHSELRAARIDAVIADKNDQIVALLVSAGWHAAAHEDSRVLLRPGDAP